MIKIHWTEDGDIDIDKMASQLWYDSNKLSGVGELKTLLGNLCKEVWTDGFKGAYNYRKAGLLEAFYDDGCDGHIKYKFNGVILINLDDIITDKNKIAPYPIDLADNLVYAYYKNERENGKI